MPVLAALGWWVPLATVPAAVCWVACTAAAAVNSTPVGQRSGSDNTPSWATPGVLLAMLRCALSVLIGGLMFFCVLIVLGASVRTSLHDTCSLAWQLSAAIVAPSAATHGFDLANRRRLINVLRLAPDTDRSVDTVLCCAGVGALSGAWLGAVALPLDWGAWWQVWPLPCIAGLVVGHAAGAVVGLASCTKEKPPERHV
jgi:hypothetical protein